MDPTKQKKSLKFDLLGNICFENVPVPEVSWCDPPHIVLQYPPADGGPRVALVGAIPLRQLAGRGQGSIVDGLKYLFVQKPCFLAIEGMSHEDEGVCQALHSNTNGTVSKVGLSCLKS